MANLSSTVQSNMVPFKLTVPVLLFATSIWTRCSVHWADEMSIKKRAEIIADDKITNSNFDQAIGNWPNRNRK